MQEPLDFEVYYYNLTEANLTPKLSPKWKKLYSFKEAYGVASLRPTDLNDLVETIGKNQTFKEQYYR